jgi:DNA-binding NtrC family response regulator
VLKELGMDIYGVHTYWEAQSLLSQTQPQLVFTDSSISDGAWVDVPNMAEESDAPVNVIVLGTSPNPNLFTSVMERGAFGLVVPAFEYEALAHVVRSAELDVHHRRKAQARAGVA